MNIFLPPAAAVVFSFVAAGCAGEWNGARTSLPAAEMAPSTRSPAGSPVADIDGFANLLGRVREDYLQSGARQAPAAIATLNERGEWPDINYGDRGVGEWRPAVHLERVRAMAVVYAADHGPYARSVELRDAIVRALRSWVARHPQSDNWWHNTIGVQLSLMPILVLMDAELPADLRSSLLAVFVPLAAVPADRKTGQNLVWYAAQSIVMGALTRSAAHIAMGRNAVLAELAITTGEGLQADMSFHQHGNQLYSGGYGRGFLIDVARLADWLRGSAWQLPAAQTHLLADYAVSGVGPLVRGEWLDWSARGREVTRQEQTPMPELLREPVRRLVGLAPDRSEELARLHARLLTAGPPDQTRTYGYWRSDFLVHQAPAGYFSVKMVSRRTVGTESGNGENLLGYWLPFGATFIVGTGGGREYLGLQPLLDWSALPGTTAPQMVPRFNGYLRHPEDRVALLSSADFGMASMQVNTQGLQAKKFWFVDGETMVALGADIRYSGPQRVRTTLNQTRWAGDATSSAGHLPERAGATDLTRGNVRWLVHGGVCYVVLDEQSATLNVKTRGLAGADPTTTAFGAEPGKLGSAEIMILSIDHGSRPKGSRYAYAVVHGVTDATQAQGMTRPKVLANSPSAQGALSADGSRLAVVFHQPGQIALGNGLSLQADQAVAVLGRVAGAQLQLLTIDLAGQGGNVTLQTFKDGRMLDQKVVPTPANTQRTREAPAGTTTLALDR